MQNYFAELFSPFSFDLNSCRNAAANAPRLAYKEKPQEFTVKAVSQQFLAAVQVDNSRGRDGIPAVMYCMYSLGKCDPSWVDVRGCVVVDGLCVFLLLRQTVSVFAFVYLNVLENEVPSAIAKTTH